MTLLAAFLTLSLISSGCIRLQLSQFEKRAARHDYEWIATQRIECREVSSQCSRLHLIKGDACFRLAKAGKTPVVSYTIAANELENGLALRRVWDNTGLRLQMQEKLCEALKSLLVLQSGDEATQTLDRFMEAAKALYRLTPESVPAVYYLSTARLRQMEPMLVDINAATRVPICIRLKRTVNHVLSMIELADRQSLPEWKRFDEDYQKLAFDLGSTMNAADCW